MEFIPIYCIPNAPLKGVGNHAARVGTRSVHLPAQPGIAADRFAREIGGILKVSPSALAAAEWQGVRRLVSRATWKMFKRQEVVSLECRNTAVRQNLNSAVEK